MFVMSVDLGNELREARSLLAGSIRGQERLRLLAEQYRAYFGLSGDLNEAKRRETAGVAESSAVTASRA